MELTFSVRSFQTPPTPLTSACPPSFPSVPTSRATRVTSPANAFNCSTMVLTTRAVRWNSPLSGRPSTSSGTVCVRSPFATAPITRAISVDGCTRSPTRLFSESTEVFQLPRTAPILARWAVFPSFPTVRLTRSNSFDIRSLSSMMSFRVSAIRPETPPESDIRTEKSPRLTAVRTFRSSRVSTASGLPLEAVAVLPLPSPPVAVRPFFCRIEITFQRGKTGRGWKRTRAA